MELIHKNIISPLFELIGTYELDINFAGELDDDSFSLRIELFRSLSNKKMFRYKAWRNEFFKIQSTFPRNNSGGHLHEPSDELILVSFSQPHFGPCDEFLSDTPKKALSKIVKDLEKLLEHITAKKLMIRRD